MENGIKQRSQPRGKLLLAAVMVLALNSAYLAAYGDPDLFYVANALLHPVLGILVGILFILFLARHREYLQGFAGKGSVALLAGGAGYGIYLIFVGMTHPHSLALYIHVGLMIAGLFFALARLGGWSREEPEKLADSTRSLRRAWRWAVIVMPACLVFYGGVALYHYSFPNQQYIIHNPPTAPLSMDQEGGGRNSLMFPSSAVTSDGKPIPAQFFLNSKSCEPCHRDIYRQWSSSMHHFSSFNNQWYRKSIEYMQDTVGIKPSMWCAGCHDHAVAFTDRMQKHPIREIEFTSEGQAGLGCMSCHAIVQVKSTMGQGNYVMEYPALDRLASSKNPVLRALHNFAIKLDPKPHRNVFLKPFHHQRGQVAEFCSTCHKVHLDVPVNHYRWIRGFDDYDNWQASGVSGQGARSFYYPPKPLVCVDCHMPLVRSNDFGNIHGYVHSHRFVAANTAVPTSHGDEKQVKDVEKFLQGTLSIDIFGIAQEPKAEVEQPLAAGVLGPQLSSSFAVGEESAQGLASPEVAVTPPLKLMAPLNRGVGRLRRGDTVRVEVVVRTLRVGHFFPGGTVDAFDCWVELQARDDKGHIIFWSGETADDGKGPVDPSAHFYRSLQLDEHGNVINKRNAWSTHATVYARLIPPGSADTVHYRLKIPEDCGDKITFTATLNYRKFDWWITQWAFAGVRDPNQRNRETTPYYDNTRWLFTGSLQNVSASIQKIPNVPIVVIAKDQVTVPVVPKTAPPPEQDIKLDSKDRDRWNDYGIGLLLQGDLKGAERAFKEVTTMDPRYADGWVNIARALIQEGNTHAAIPYLQKALAIRPGLASAHYFMGLMYKSDGKYPQAYNEFAKAATIYPNDRVVRDQMGRMLFLQRKYADAVKQYDRTLSVDPEDLEAHYNLMLCYRGLGNDALSDREEKLYLRFKADEAARAITGPFKLANPVDNNEAQPIHEHESINDQPASAFKFYWDYGQRWDWLPGKDGRKQEAALTEIQKHPGREHGAYQAARSDVQPRAARSAADRAGARR